MLMLIKGEDASAYPWTGLGLEFISSRTNRPAYADDDDQEEEEEEEDKIM